MTPAKQFAGLCTVLLIASVGGCAMFNNTSGHYSRTTTLGQELIDLKAAQDRGAITAQEFVELKEQVVKAGTFTPEAIDQK